MTTTQSQPTTCPICNDPHLEETPTPLPNYNRNKYKCKRCGTFGLDNFLETINNPYFDRVRHLVSAWIRQQNKLGVLNVVVGQGMDVEREDWPLAFERMGFPETTGEKLNALLLAYADRAGADYQHVINQSDPSLISEVAARDASELGGLTQLLVQLKYLERSGSRINAHGWLRVDELRRIVSDSDSAFVAMWFDESTTAYRRAVTKAMEYCHYRPIIVDQEQFNGFIMDKVISLVRQARFLIADFTARPECIDGSGVLCQGVRGGVYWEAGMAYGMGKPVIHTCQDSPEAKARIHFDVDQYNTIFWKDDELCIKIRELESHNEKPTFAERLVARIIKTVGQGTWHAPRGQGISE